MGGSDKYSAGSSLFAFCEAPEPVLDFGPERGSAKGTMADLGPLIRHLVSTRLPPGGRAAFLSPLSPHIALSEPMSSTGKQGSSLGSFPTSPPLYPHFNRPSGFSPCVKSCLVGGSDKYSAGSSLFAFCFLRSPGACSGLRSGAWLCKRNNGRLGAFN